VPKPVFFGHCIGDARADALGLLLLALS